MTPAPRHSFGRLYVRPVGAAGAAFVLACAVAGWAASRALTLESRPRVRRVSGARAGALASSDDRPGVAADTLSDDRFGAALDRDPFHPERRRPGIAFRLPGEPDPDAAAAADTAAAAVSPPPAIRLVGTVVTAAGDAFAMCQLGTEAPRVVRPGAKLGEYTLVRVEQGRAVFRSPDGEPIDLRAPKPGS